jgi:hypothetical protein
VAQKLDAKRLYLYKNIIYEDLAQWRQQDQHFQCSELPDGETKRLCSIFSLSNGFMFAELGIFKIFELDGLKKRESQKVLSKCRPSVLDE